MTTRDTLGKIYAGHHRNTEITGIMLQLINAGKSMYIPWDDLDLVTALPLGVEALHAQLSVVEPILADSVPHLNKGRGKISIKIVKMKLD